MSEQIPEAWGVLIRSGQTRATWRVSDSRDEAMRMHGSVNGSGNSNYSLARDVQRLVPAEQLDEARAELARVESDFLAYSDDRAYRCRRCHRVFWEAETSPWCDLNADPEKAVGGAFVCLACVTVAGYVECPGCEEGYVLASDETTGIRLFRLMT